MMTALQIDLSPLREQAIIEFERTIAPAQLQDLVAGSAVLTGPLTLRLRVARHGAKVSLEGALSGEWELACARCLGPARKPLQAQIEGEAPMSAEPIDISEEARQALYLALPMNSLCRPDCRGLCPICGVNRNETQCACRPALASARRLNAQPKT